VQENDLKNFNNKGVESLFHRLGANEMVAESILVICPNSSEQNQKMSHLEKNWEVTLVNSLTQGLQLIRQKRFAVIVLDDFLCGDGKDKTINDLIFEDPDPKIILLESLNKSKPNFKGIQKKIYQTLEKETNSKDLGIAIRNAIENYQITRENARLREGMRQKLQYEFILGKSPKMQKVWSVVEKISSSDASVLIEGESGTGKEIVARIIHQKSNRKEGPLITVNCAALSKGLIESELFGHVKGAFTGAFDTTKGRFEAADGGTLFLDEIGEIALELQPKLLRMIQEKTFERVGSHETRCADVRILTATNRDLKTFIKEGSFREDLFFRLNVVHIKIPPLRDRREDIPDFIEFFLARFITQRGMDPPIVSSEAMNFLMNYQYPGNIRELANMIERATLLCERDQIQLEHLLTPVSFEKRKSHPLEKQKPGTPFLTDIFEAKAEFEIFHLTQLLMMTKLLDLQE